MSLALLQTGLTLIDVGLPKPTMLNRPIPGLLPQMNREPLNINNDEAQYEAFKTFQDKYVKNKDPHHDELFYRIYSNCALWWWRTMDIQGLHRC